MAKETLLQKAKNIQTQNPIQRKFSDEELELVLAFVRNEISLTQVGKVLGKKSITTCYVWCFRALQEAIRTNKTNL